MALARDKYLSLQAVWPPRLGKFECWAGSTSEASFHEDPAKLCEDIVPLKLQVVRRSTEQYEACRHQPLDTTRGGDVQLDYILQLPMDSDRRSQDWDNILLMHRRRNSSLSRLRYSTIAVRTYRRWKEAAPKYSTAVSDCSTALKALIVADGRD